MTEDLVPYDVAVLLKEKGFPQSKKKVGKYTNLEYIETGGIQGGGGSMGITEYFEAPNLSQVAKWLRARHNIIVWTRPLWLDDGEYQKVTICKKEHPSVILKALTVKGPPEVALSDGIKEALKI